MYKLGALGDKESMLPFKAFGIVTYECTKAEDAKVLLSSLARENYGLILITEELALELQEELKTLQAEKLFPVIIEIPSRKGATGLSRQKIKRMVERAVGADILK